MKKILVTGAGGFIGKNLVWRLQNAGHDVLAYHHRQGADALRQYCRECDFVFHLAGVNRPDSPAEFAAGNVNFTSTLTGLLQEAGNACPIVFASSVQAAEDNPYGRSKREAENILREYGQTSGAQTMIYRLPNVFGKWCRPNYNSAVATFCHNAARGLPLVVDAPARMMRLVYIDDVADEFMAALHDSARAPEDFCAGATVYSRRLGEVADIIRGFADCRRRLSVPNQTDELTKKLYGTYLSFLPDDDFSYELKAHEDNRGYFAEFMRTAGQGQFSVNVSKPNIVKGNHWHHSKHEKFLVVSGEGLIRLRRIDAENIIEYAVSGARPRVVEIPPGYTHNIQNIGDGDLVTLIWANENFDPANPDTYAMEV